MIVKQAAVKTIGDDDKYFNRVSLRYKFLTSFLREFIFWKFC